MATALPQVHLTDPQGMESRHLGSSPTTSPVKESLSPTQQTRTAARAAVAGRTSSNKLAAGITQGVIANINETAMQSNSNVLERPRLQNGMDPLSQHISRRTQTYIQDSLLDQPGRLPILNAGTSRLAESAQPDPGAQQPKEKSRKTVKFITRIIGNKKKNNVEDDVEDEVELGEDRPEGAQAQLFHQTFDNMGFKPCHPPPPAYIKMRSRNKKQREFNRVFLAQELCSKRNPIPPAVGTASTPKSEASAIWAMEFTNDGKYLATAGQDKLVRVWAVLCSPQDRRTHEKQEDAHEKSAGQKMRLSAPVFRDEPIRTYIGHTGSVLDLSWSKNNFLLSSAMDKTVRLWHITRSECLCAFKHNDFVTSIKFHPRDDRFFLAGSLDSRLRLWSIPDKTVAYWNHLPDMITAVAFTPDGKTAIAGCLTGLCLFYETEGLKYQTQLHAKSSYGKNARGSKITGIKTVNMPPEDPTGEVKLLITTNDSRTRLYNLRDKGLEMKFKGNDNASSQMHARFSDDAKYVICGSEDKKVFIWSVGPVEVDKKDRRPVEMFEAHTAATTVALLAPVKTRQLLSYSEDPIYDLCNPPPVTLVSKSEVDSIYSSKPPTENGSVPATPATAEGGGTFRRPEFSASYIARSVHTTGNIIVTADASGAIKVFRQDCAHEKRPSDDSSSLFSKAVGSSFVRRASLATHDLGRSRSNSNGSQPPSDRIISWRQSVSSTGGLEKTPSGGFYYLARKDRTPSPRKPPQFSRQSSNATGTTLSDPATSESLSQLKTSTDTDVSHNQTTRLEAGGPSPKSSQSPSHEDKLQPQASVPETPGTSRHDDTNIYFQREAWKDQLINQLQTSNKLAECKQVQGEASTLDVPRPNPNRTPSVVSALSSELSSVPENGR